MTEPLYTITKQDVLAMIDKMQSEELVPGQCQYSAPCVLGSIMPQEVIDQLVSMGKDCISFDALVNDNLIACAPDVESYNLEAAQLNFDAGGEDGAEYVVDCLKKAII